MNIVEYIKSALIGTSRARQELQDAMLSKPSIRTGIEQLNRSCHESYKNDSERPIFLLSAGWRAGSTLLQRLIMSDSRVLIWGEPYDECGIIQVLANSNKAFRPDWPPEDYYYDGSDPEKLSSKWVANLFPSIDEWRHGQRALFDTMFAEPAKKAGASLWGIKEVRLSIEHALYLQWLYPNARFLFLYRNPLDAYVSYSRYGRNWYNIWPHEPMFTPTEFGNHWRELMEGYIKYAEDFNGILVKYEDLVSGNLDIAVIEQYLDIKINYSLLKNKVGSSDRAGEKAWVSRLEKYLLKRAVSPTAEKLGYKW